MYFRLFVNVIVMIIGVAKLFSNLFSYFAAYLPGQLLRHAHFRNWKHNKYLPILVVNVKIYTKIFVENLGQI